MHVNDCQCNKLKRVVVGGLELLNLRCPHCIDAIMEAKNELVRENNRLRQQAEVPLVPQ